MLFAHGPAIPPPSSSSLLFRHYATSLSWTRHQVFLSIVWYRTDYLRSLSGYYATIYSLFGHYATLLHVIWVLCNSRFSIFAIFGYYATFYSLSRNVNPSPFTRRTRRYHRQHLSSFLYLPIYLFLLLGSNCFQYTHVFNCSLVKY
jgi:hypothetical protein